MSTSMPKKSGVRKTLLLLPVLLILFSLIIPSCKPGTGLSDEQKLELINDIKAFEKNLGFNDTNNFLTYSDEIEAYHYYFYTSSTEIPYSLDDPKLQCGIGAPKSVTIDPEKHDAYFYSIPAIAGVETPVTKSLLNEPLYRFIHIIFHEDWQEQMDSPLGIEEPCSEVVSYTAAMLFTKEKFGSDSEVHNTLKKHFNNKLRESEIYADYYEKLNAVYASFHAGEIADTEIFVRKERLLESMGNELRNVWGGGKPSQLNNAFIAFQMTYLRHLPIMHEVLLATDFDLIKTIAIFRSMPGQGSSYDNLDEVKAIEKKVTDYLYDNLPESQTNQKIK